MRKLFGTDGIRGVAGEPPLDAPTISAIGAALAHSLKEKSSEPRVLLGADTRQSSPWIAGVLAAALEQEGTAVENAGIITTPGVAYLTHKHGFQGRRGDVRVAQSLAGQRHQGFWL